MVRAWVYAAALLAVHLSSVAAQSTNAIDAQNVFNLAGTVYNRTGTLLPLHFNVYTIPVPSNETNLDILITLNSTSGGTGLALYCNPQFGAFGVASLPGPGNAVWMSELSTRINQIFISKNDPYYTASTTTSTNTSNNSSTVQIPFQCSVINSDVNTTTNFTLNTAIVSDNRTLDATEQSALATLYARCCPKDGSCNFWKAQNRVNSTNANGSDVRTDFCSFPGQICSPTGRLYRMDMGGWNLTCEWPSDLLSAFSQLDTLNVESNPGLTGNTSAVFASVANITSLQFLDISQDTGITGVIENGTASQDICKAVKADLASINMNGMGMRGIIPTCLYSADSKVIALDLGANSFSGSLNGTIPPGSPLQLLHVQDNQLSGSLPPSLGNATYLVDVNVTNNRFSGTIPSAVGAIVPLRSFVAAMNNFSGAIPDSFGTSNNLETFDVKGNRFTALPAAWTNASYDASNSSYYSIRASFNNITGPFPAGLMNAQQLGYLVLNVNNMTGQLPSNNSMFISLRALNISYNSLTGTIPQQFNQTGIFSAAPTFLGSGRPLQQVFDLSNNKFSGSLPSFLASSNVPSWTANGIFLQGNNLTIDCANSNYSYLTSVCPNGNQTTNTSQVPLQPAATPQASPVQGAPSGIPTLTPPNTATTSTSNAPAAQKSGGSGLSSGAIAGIVVGVLVALALAGVLAFLAVRRRRKDPMMPRTYDNGTFSMPNFGDGEFGRKSSLRKGLNTMQSSTSGFERFDDEPQGAVELAQNGNRH